MALAGKGWIRLVVETGIGVDQHGQDPTRASIKAIRDAIQRVCLPVLVEEYKATPEDILVVVEIGVPYPEKVDKERLIREIPLEGRVELRIYDGGLKTSCVAMREYGDKTSEMLIAVVAITVYVRRAGA